MTCLTFFTWLGAIAIGATGLAAAQTVTTGNLSFERPTNAPYDQQEKNDGVLFQHKLTSPSGHGGGVIILVGTLRSPAGSFDPAFARLADGIDQMKGQKYLVEKKGITTTGQPARWMLKCCRGNSSAGASMSMTLVAFQDGDTLDYAELLMVGVSRDEDKGYTEAFEKLVASFAFDGGKPRPPVPSAPVAGSETLNGLFLNVSNQLMPNAFGGMDFRVDMNTYVFDPTGYFATAPLYGVPTIAEFCQHHSTDCGTYQVKNGQIVLNAIGKRFGIVEVENESLAHDGNALKLGDRSFNPVEPVHDLKLTGSWTYFWASAGSTATSSGGVASSHTIVFSPDGRFKRSGFTGVSTTNESGGTSTGVTVGNPSAEQSGTYRIDGYTLTMTIDGGQTETDSIYLPDKTDTGLLVINGNSYLGDDKKK